MKRKILLVYPSYPKTFWGFYESLKFIGAKAAFPPLGLLTIASMLPPDWELRLIDNNVEGLKNEDILWADMVFISAMLIQGPSAQEIINRCHSLQKVIVAGGPAFITSHEKFNHINHCLLGEAEIILPRFLADLENGQAQDVYFEEGEKPSLAITPIPKWSLLKNKLKNYATMVVQNSRGCPYDCEFCDIIVMNGRVPRLKSIKQIIAELQALYEIGWRGGVFFGDDNFIGNKNEVKKMLPILIAWQKKYHYPFTFFTQASVNLADEEELMKLMSQANFNKVFLGIETDNLDSLKECGKFQNTKADLTEVIKKIQGYGLQVMGGFIVGFDHDKENVFDNMTKFIQGTGIVTAMVGMLNAMPKTKLWHRMNEEKRLIGNSVGNNTSDNLNFTPTMGAEKLSQGYKKLIAKLYSRKLFSKRVGNFIKDYKPTAKERFSFKKIRAFVRSVFKIGILSGSRWLYWKSLATSLIKNARTFPTVVELMIHWVHYQRRAKEISR